MAVQKKKKAIVKPVKFDKKLVLNQWMLGLFEVTDLERLADGLKNPDLEGFDDDNMLSLPI